MNSNEMNVDSGRLQQRDGEDLSDGTDNPEQQTLIEHAKNGDKEAFVTLMLSYEYILRSIVRSFIRNISGYEEDELVNEIIVRAYQVIPDFAGEEREFKSWLRRTTWGVCNNIRKKQKKEQNKKHEVEKYSQPSPQKPDEAYAEAEIQTCVQKAIGLLPERLKEVVILRDIEGLAYKEIAENLRVPMGTIQSRLDRARKLLKKFLEDLHCMEML